MLISEITPGLKVANDAADASLKNQAKQVKVKRARLSADKAQQRATAAQQRLRKVQSG